MTPPHLTLVRAQPRRGDAGDRVTPDGVWSLTSFEQTDTEEGGNLDLVVATHLASGLEVSHPLAGIDDWLISGVALDELTAQAVSTFKGIALEEEKTAARDALVSLGLLLSADDVAAVTFHCQCYGFLAYAPGRRLVHVDVCRTELDGRYCQDRIEHQICLAPSARACEHPHCNRWARTDVPDCPHLYCCGQCCAGDPSGD